MRAITGSRRILLGKKIKYQPKNRSAQYLVADRQVLSTGRHQIGEETALFSLRPKLPLSSPFFSTGCRFHELIRNFYASI